MQDAKQSSRCEKCVRRRSSTNQRTRRRLQLQLLQLYLWLRRIHVQSAAAAALGFGLFYYLSLCGRRFGDPHPCDARVGGGGGGRRVRRCALAVALVVVRCLILRGGLGRAAVRCRRRGILIVDRLYYRIIRLGLLLLFLCLRRRRFFLLLLSLLVL